LLIAARQHSPALVLDRHASPLVAAKEFELPPGPPFDRDMPVWIVWQVAGAPQKPNMGAAA